MYDFEAVYQDADIEMAEYAAEAHQMAKAEAAGVCTHQGTTHLKCDECGRQFSSDEDWIDAVNRAVWNWE